MMYLFLTAMLAINVSNEVLEAFAIVDAGLAKTIKTFDVKNHEIYNSFEQAYEINQSKVKEARNNALEVKKRSDSLYNYIQQLKWIVVRKADGEKADIKNIRNKDNIDIPAEVMIVNQNGKKLKNAIVQYREFALSLINEKDVSLRNAITENLETKDPPVQDGAIRTWESLQFSNIPLIGAVTLMSKMQTDLRNTESDLINYIYNQIEAESFKFNKLKAKVFPKSNYIFKGDEYEAEILLAAVDTTQNPLITIKGGNLIKEFKDGRGIYRITPKDVGRKKWGGVIHYKTPSGQQKQYEFESEYVVAEPSVVVSPTKMNVFYVGVDNPVSISVPGIPSDRIRAKMTNGDIVISGKNYIVRPQTPGKLARVTVEAKFNETYRPLTSVDFRVKLVPDPVPMVAGKSGGTIKKNLLLAQTGVDAVMQGFDFDLQFKVTGFTVSAIVKSFTRDRTSYSNMFTEDQLNMIKNLSRNQKVYIEDIRAVGPDGVTRKLPTISLRID